MRALLLVLSLTPILPLLACDAGPVWIGQPEFRVGRGYTYVVEHSKDDLLRQLKLVPALSEFVWRTHGNRHEGTRRDRQEHVELLIDESAGDTRLFIGTYSAVEHLEALEALVLWELDRRKIEYRRYRRRR